MNRIEAQIDKEYSGIVFSDDGKIPYSELKSIDKFVLYLIERMNGPLLTVLSGIISSLSINLLTNFVEIDLGKGVWLSILSLVKLLSCLVFNISLVYFTLVTLNASSSITIPKDVLPVEKKEYKQKQLLKYYYKRKGKLRSAFVSCVVFGILTVLLIIATPFVAYFLQSKIESS